MGGEVTATGGLLPNVHARPIPRGLPPNNRGTISAVSSSYD